jgi:hypothetical protein
MFLLGDLSASIDVDQRMGILDLSLEDFQAIPGPEHKQSEALKCSPVDQPDM